MENKKQTSLYDFIASAVVDGQLPKDFSLPQKANKNEIRWMDGAMDGVYIYHMGFSELADDNKALMIEAVLAASKKRLWQGRYIILQVRGKGSCNCCNR